MSVLSLFLVVPKGYEERTTAIVADSKESAHAKALQNPSIGDLVRWFGCDLLVHNLSDTYAKQGYDIIIQHRRMLN